jgi:hypothetical protein
MKMSKDDLIGAGHALIGGNLKDLSIDEIHRLMTVTQYVTDICLNEIEGRGALTFYKGSPILPYQSKHMVETVLTRGAVHPCLSGHVRPIDSSGTL